MLDVRQIAEEIVAREGGYVNDLSDPGGATKHGVTIGTMKTLGIDLNKDGVVNIADVKLLTQAQAVDIYLRHYFESPGSRSFRSVCRHRCLTCMSTREPTQ